MQFEGSKRVAKTYGGSLFKDIKVCADKVSGCTGAGNANDNKSHIQSGGKECKQSTDCTASTSYTCTSAGGGTVTPTADCIVVNTAGGECAAGVCSK